MSEIQTFRQLAEIIQRDFDQLTPSQQRISQLLLSDPEDCAFMTISEMASATEVNESTVVRFATAVGLEGYVALTRLCQEYLREQAQLVQRFEIVQAHSADSIESLSRTASLEQTNIERTLARIDSVEWERAIQAIAAGRHVYTFGLRLTYAAAYTLAYLLQLVREGVVQLSLDAGSLPDRIRGIGEADVFIATGINRYHAEVVRALEFAAERGATTIALTDNAASPLARLADTSFYVDTSGISVLRSITAFVSLAQALAAGVSARLDATTRLALAAEEDLLTYFGVYFDPDGRRPGAARPANSDPSVEAGD